MPTSCIRSATPSSARMAVVGGWNEPARKSWVRPGSASRIVTGTLALARASAATSPTGPAPTTTTCSDPLTLRSLARRIFLADDTEDIGGAATFVLGERLVAGLLLLRRLFLEKTFGRRF